MENFEWFGFGAVTVLCYLCGEAVKCTPLASRWIPVICGITGGLLGVIAHFVIPGFPASDVLSAAAEGIVSGLAATGANQAYRKITEEREVG